MLKILYHHRIADTDVFRVMLPGSDQQIGRELTLLFDEPNLYVGRPKDQWVMHGKGNSEIIYALTNKGMKYLEDKFGYEVPKTSLNKKNREIGITTIFHDNTLTQFWAGLKVALEQKKNRTKEPYNLIIWQQDRADREQLKTEIFLRNGEAVNIIPDAAFKFQFPKGQGLFFVEYYRTRKSNQIFLNKLKLYNLYPQKAKAEKYQVKKQFRVISIVPSRRVAENLIKLINSSKENEELRRYWFWFVSEQDYWLYQREKIRERTWKKTQDVESILKPIFRIPIDEKWHSLEE